MLASASTTIPSSPLPKAALSFSTPQAANASELQKARKVAAHVALEGTVDDLSSAAALLHAMDQDDSAQVRLS